MTFTSDELRMIGVGGTVWLRMLKNREENIVARMHGEFRGGKTDFLSAIAELACIRDQINEITSAIRQNQNQKE